MKKIQQSLYVTALTVLSGSAIAHPGHNHGHWLSEPIHVLSALAVGAVVVTAAVVYKKKKAAK